MDYKEILKLLETKDKRGLEELYILFANKFYGYAIKKWNFSEDDATDVIYQTLETLIIKLNNYKFESKQHFDNFIFKVFINFLRQKFRYNRKMNDEISFINLSEIELEKISNSDINFDNLNIFFEKDSILNLYQDNKHEKLELLTKVLDMLEQSDKDLLLLRAQNFSYEEIAKLLGIENNQLKVKHHRAKGKLLKLIENELINKNE